MYWPMGPLANHANQDDKRAEHRREMCEADARGAFPGIHREAAPTPSHLYLRTRWLSLIFPSKASNQNLRFLNPSAQYTDIPLSPLDEFDYWAAVGWISCLLSFFFVTYASTFCGSGRCQLKFFFLARIFVHWSWWPYVGFVLNLRGKVLPCMVGSVHRVPRTLRIIRREIVAGLSALFFIEC